ncbi:MAG TPA: c-type cytochrome [Pirellulaceae bacterium]
MPRCLISCLFVFFVVLLSLGHADDDVQRAKDAIVVRALARLPGIDLSTKPDAEAALLRHLETIKATDSYFDLIEKFKLRELGAQLLQIAAEASDSTIAVKAARLLVKFDDRELLAKAIADQDSAKAAKIVEVLGLLADAKTNDLVASLITEADKPLAARAAAVTALGRNAPGEKRLLEIVEQERLPADTQFAAANALLSSSDEAIRTRAAKRLSLPAAAGGEPLPPVAELVRRTGDAERGKTLFNATGTCAKCHKVNGEGKDVGPDLSEIGSKLSKEAMYVSILDPNAGVSFNYETYVARTLDGTTLSGILVSQTDDSVELKTAEAVVHKLKRDDIEALKKLPTSLMPADLQKQIKADDLVDIVEYLTTLKKRN